MSRSRRLHLQTVTVPSVTLTENREATIPLHPGWNIISNPLDIDVSWSAVEQANGVDLQPIWGFEGSFSESAAFASPKVAGPFIF